MHSSSNVTWRARTSAAERGSVISGSGRTGPDRASYRHRRSYTGTHSVTATLRPEPFSPTPPGHALAGWGATPLGLLGQLVREAEAREDLGRAERGDGDDAGALPRQDVQGGREVAALLRVELVGGEGKLPVGPGRQVPQACRGSGGHEPRPGQGVATAAPARIGRHRESRILGEHGDDHIDLSRFQGVGETMREITEPVVAERSHGFLLALAGKPGPEGLAGTLQGAMYRCGRGIERSGHLLGREAEHVAEDEHGALPGGQMLQRRDEGQLHGLALLIAGLGRGVPVRDPQSLVGVRLHPDWLRYRLLGL